MQLTIGNSYSRIEGCTGEQLQALKKLLSYKVDPATAYFSGGKSALRYLIDKKGNFPSGLLYIVQDWLERQNTPYGTYDPRLCPTPRQDARGALQSMPSGVTPYPEQIEAVEALVRARRGVFSAVTGFGKSVTMALLCLRLALRTLIVVPNLELKRQLTETFIKVFGNLNNIVIENIDSPALKTLTDFQVLIIDESHHSAAKTYRTLNRTAWNKIYWRFCFTATSFRSREDEQLLMESVTGPVVYRVTYQDAVAKGYIVPLEAFYYDLPKQTMKGNPRHWPAVYSELVVNNKARNALIQHVMRYLEHLPTLCLVREILHGEALSAGTGVPFANGADGEAATHIQKFCSGEYKNLIGTAGVLGEGVDTRPAEFIVMAQGGKAKTAFMQACGRGFRRYPDKESCRIILFRDASNKYLLKHYAECVKHLRDEYGVVPAKLELPEGLT